jgi:hypothetical protein
MYMGPGLARPQLHKTTYAPMIYTSLCVRFLIWADRFRGEGGGGGVGAGWALTHGAVFF